MPATLSISSDDASSYVRRRPQYERPQCGADVLVQPVSGCYDCSVSATLTRQLEDRVRRELPSLDEAQARELAGVIEQLVTAFQPESIYAFGSRARGDAGPDSDVDLMVVVPESDEPEYRRAQAAYALVNRKRLLPLDILIWTRREFDERLPNPATLPGTIGREGKLLYATR